MNFCSINEAWGEANTIENKEDESTEASFKNNIWKSDIFDKNKNNNNKNNKNIETIISEDSSSSKCLSSSSIESFDIIPKKNRKTAIELGAYCGSTSSILCNLFNKLCIVEDYSIFLENHTNTNSYNMHGINEHPN